MSRRIKLADNPFLVTRPIQPNREQRAAVLRQYGVCDSYGNLIRCKPSTREIAERTANNLAPVANKVIFPDKRAAIRAGVALRRLGMDPMIAYVCPRSKSGHAHLTRKGAQ